LIFFLLILRLFSRSNSKAHFSQRFCDAEIARQTQTAICWQASQLTDIIGQAFPRLKIAVDKELKIIIAGVSLWGKRRLLDAVVLGHRIGM